MIANTPVAKGGRSNRLPIRPCCRVLLASTYRARACGTRGREVVSFAGRKANEPARSRAQHGDGPIFCITALTRPSSRSGSGMNPSRRHRFMYTPICASRKRRSHERRVSAANPGYRPDEKLLAFLEALWLRRLAAPERLALQGVSLRTAYRTESV